VHNFRIL